MNVLYVILLIIHLFGCTNPKTPNSSLGQITLSLDDKTVIFSYTKNGISSLYLLNLESRKVQLIVDSKTDSFTSPKFSPDGKSIIFIGHAVDSLNSDIYIADTEGSNIKKLTTSDHIITEAMFSLNREMIYFVKADEYDKYSPIGIKSAHNFDIYGLELKSRKVIRVTNRNAYKMSSISYIKEGEVMFEELNKGMFMVQVEQPQSIKQILPSNNPREGLYSGYGTPVYSNTFDMLAFTAPYELYIMNLSDREAKKVYRDTGYIQQVMFFNKQPRLLFSVEGENSLQSVNFDGTNLEVIQIELPD